MQQYANEDGGEDASGEIGKFKADDKALAAQSAPPDWNALEALFAKKTKFGRKVPMREALAWSKKPLDKPLTKLDAKHEKAATTMCQLVYEYVSAAPGAEEAARQSAQTLVDGPIRVKELRDELYGHVVRLLNGCHDPHQQQRAWQLAAICLSLFPPSEPMELFLRAFLHHWLPACGDLVAQRSTRLCRRWCIAQLRRVTDVRSVSARRPPLDELAYYETAPLGPPSPFGASLDECMRLQAKLYPQYGHTLPALLTVPIEFIRQLDGFSSQVRAFGARARLNVPLRAFFVCPATPTTLWRCSC